MHEAISPEKKLRRFKHMWLVAVGAAAFFVFAPPLQIYKFLAPPYGPTESNAAQIVCLISVAAVFSCAVTLRTSARKRVASQKVNLWLAFIVFLIIYSGLYLRLVRSVGLGEGNRYSVIIGFEKTDWANQYYPAATDEEILEQNGATEERIHKVWSSSSVLWANLLLGFFFCGMVDILFVIALMQSWLDLDAQEERRRRRWKLRERAG